jgi:23S rRNA pseudouridine1911/1915/1917 synthase
MQILLETNEYMVINKPAGISVHGDGKVDVPTVADWILEKYPELADVGEPMEVQVGKEGAKFLKKILRPGIVHRLDKDTTGCLLIAKNQVVFEHFKKQFQDHTIQKTYHCFVYGAIKASSGVIDEPIGRSRGDIRRWTTGGAARGTIRDAVTEYTVLARLGVEEGKGSTDRGTYSLVECRPRTGRTHQIRVHMKSINHPILYDMLYAEKRIETGTDLPEYNLGFERLALHAKSLCFTDPFGERIVISAPYPLDFEHALQLIAKK